MWNMSNQQWLAQCKQIVWNVIGEISSRSKNTMNNNERHTFKQLSTLSNSKMPN
jgi:hypothetical protein